MIKSKARSVRDKHVQDVSAGKRASKYNKGKHYLKEKVPY